MTELITKDTPSILIIFGATGDLFKKKMAPALFHLFAAGQLPRFFSVVGFSRPALTDEEFQDMTHEAVMKHLGSDVLDNEFLKLFSYRRGDFNSRPDYQILGDKLGKIDGGWRACANKLFYLAVPPQFSESILNNLSETGLTKACGDDVGWTRVLVEKPFGKNLKEAQKLDLVLGNLFKEEQVFRIDHYLAKELLQNILTFRFANNLLEDVWNNKYIEKIEIKLLEEIGIEGRGDFYDDLGTLQDVGQNHLLQMLALVTMNNPIKVEPGNVRRKRLDILNQLRILSGEEIKTNTVRGQYGGYTEEPGVKTDSTTETYFKIKAYLNTPRWQGVPIYLESGKKMSTAQKEIAVTFKHPIPCLCPEGIKEHLTNILRFRVEPEPGISIRFWSKKPGNTMDVEEKSLDFTYEDVKESLTFMEEYAKVLLDCISGDQTLFVSSDEATAGWAFIDPIVTAWRQDFVPLQKYSPKNISSISEQISQPLIAEVKPRMEVGVVGLGKMGRGIALHLLDQGWRVTGFNRTAAVTTGLEKDGLISAYSLKEMVDKIEPPRIIWLMLPAGPIVDETIFGEDGLAGHLQQGDIIIDAGNSFYKDSIGRFNKAKEMGIHFIDVGVSGGPEGARHGASLMVGGSRETYESLSRLFTDLAVANGVQFFEGAGAGHFIKMVHNGIEYGMMQAIAEGFNILKGSDYEFDLEKAADIYDHGSVIQSQLITWLKKSYKLYGRNLDGLSGTVGYTGEGEWTVKVAKELNLEAENIEQAFKFRVGTEKNPSYTGKILTALRDQFGGHGVKG